MKMDRRDFLKVAAATGAALSGPALAFAFDESLEQHTDPSLAVEDPYFFVQVQATGGWEPTMLCDPKGNLNGTYGEGDILTAGNIPYAPLGPEWDEFFQTNFQRMVVINGIDGQTNSHDAGRRHTSSGRLGEGYPALAAIAAGYQAPHLPVSFLTFGGYEMTGGVVAPTRDIDPARLSGIAYPHLLNPTNPDTSASYHQTSSHELVAAARAARLERQVANTYLPNRRNRLDTLMTARLGSDELAQLTELLTLGGNQQENRIRLAIAAFQAGIGCAANFTRGGFDTHGNHDQNHSNRMRDLLVLINTIWTLVDEAGIADRTFMVVNSDFGRTPNYNGNMGKDHWPITSMICISDGIEEGNRVVGVTDDGHRPIMLNPSTMQEDGDGVRIEPQHVHRNIRDFLGMQGSAVDDMFPLNPADDLKIL